VLAFVPNALPPKLTAKAMAELQGPLQAADAGSVPMPGQFATAALRAQLEAAKPESIANTTYMPA